MNEALAWIFISFAFLIGVATGYYICKVQDKIKPYN